MKMENQISQKQKFRSQRNYRKINNFYDKIIPILISTNIIESGLDLPNVNTIIIHKANMFGFWPILEFWRILGPKLPRRPPNPPTLDVLDPV